MKVGDWKPVKYPSLVRPSSLSVTHTFSRADSGPHFAESESNLATGSLDQGGYRGVFSAIVLCQQCSPLSGTHSSGVFC